MRPLTEHRRTRRAGALLLAAGLFVVAACGGSQISPEDAKAANDRVRDRVSGPVTSTDTGIVVPGGTGTGGTGTGGTGTGGTGTGGTGTGGTGTGGSGTGTGGTGTGGTGTGGTGSRAASCAGFKNGIGITDTTITIGNASDISGPVPGLFAAPQQATQAYVQYFNTTNPNGICGRKLVLQTYDARTDAGAEQQATQKMCDSVFAAVGSLSAFDAGGAKLAESCGLPDLHATITQGQRNECTTCFGAQATGKNEYSNAVPDFFAKQYPAAVQKAAFLYLNAGAAAENARTQIEVESRRGMTFVYTSPIDVADFNYGPYVQQMKTKGVRYVQFIGGAPQAARLVQAMESAGFRPDVRHFDQTTDDQVFLDTAGKGADGVIISLTYKPMFEPQTELDLYKTWLQQVLPGAKPNAFGMYGWSASKLFVEQALALGGKLTRASLVNRLRGIHAWTGGGMHGPMDVGSKHTADCVRFVTVQGGRNVALPSSKKYLCTGITKVS